MLRSKCTVKLSMYILFFISGPILAMKPEEFPAHPEDKDVRPRTHSEFHVGNTVINVDSDPDITATTTYGTIPTAPSNNNTNTTKMIVTHSLVGLITAAVSAGITLGIYFGKCK
jgi:hypothetical protein